MSANVDPSGQAPVFNGTTWVSADGKYVWNGTAWQPVAAPRRRAPWIIVGLALVFIAGIAFVIRAIPGPTDTTPYGVTNTKIDSSTQIEFDYRAQKDCNSLVFDYVFYDSTGAQVDEFKDDTGSQVTANKSYHFTIQANSGQTIDSKATRFTATPTCNS
jgi:hypothetical protein